MIVLQTVVYFFLEVLGMRWCHDFAAVVYLVDAASHIEEWARECTRTSARGSEFSGLPGNFGERSENRACP